MKVRGQTEQAYRALKDGVLRGKYSPGFHLTQQELSGELGMSRTPIREALWTLSREGLVDFFPERGFFARRLNVADIVSMYEFREALEAGAVRLTAARADDAELAALGTAVETMERIERSGSLLGALIEYDEADWAFHMGILKSARNKYFASVAEQGLFHIPSLPYEMYAAGFSRFTAGAHREILNALKARDADCAERCVRHHFQDAITSMAPLLGSSPRQSQQRDKVTKTRGVTTEKRGISPAEGAVGRSFSLVELLIVIAIVALLAALLLPSLKTARDRGKGVACLGNLKQFGVAAISYAGDYNYYLPAKPAVAATSAYGCWDAQLASYVGYDVAKGPPIYHCPRGICPKQASGAFYPLYQCRGYAMNNYVATSSPTKLNQRLGMGRRDMEVMLFHDRWMTISGEDRREGLYGGSLSGGEYTSPSGALDQLATRHANRFNYVRKDGAAMSGLPGTVCGVDLVWGANNDSGSLYYRDGVWE